MSAPLAVQDPGQCVLQPDVLNRRPERKKLLRLVEDLTVYDGRVLPFRDDVRTVCLPHSFGRFPAFQHDHRGFILLIGHKADIVLISKDLVYSRSLPSAAAGRSRNAEPVQFFADLPRRPMIHKTVKDHPDRFCVFIRRERAVLPDPGPVVSIRRHGLQETAALNGGDLPAHQNFFCVFQIIAAAQKFILEVPALEFIVEIISHDRRHNRHVAVLQNVDQRAAVDQITTGQTLRLDNDHGLRITGFDTLQNALDLHAVLDRLAGHDFPVYISLRDLRTVLAETEVLQDPLVLGEDLLDRFRRRV